MKTRILITFYSFLGGIFIWILSSILNFFFFESAAGSFFEEVFKTSGHEIIIRSTIVVAFMIYGLIISNYFLEARRVKDEVRYQARFPNENPNPVLRITKSGKVLYCNPSAKQLIDKWNISVGDNVPKDWCRIIERAYTDDVIDHKEVNIRNKIYNLAIIPVHPLKYVNLYASDITERKKTLEELKANRKHLLAAQRVAKTGSWEWDSVKDKLLWSDEIYNIFGVSKDDFKPSFTEHLRFIPDEEKKSYKRKIDDALKNRKRFEYEFQINTGDSERKYTWVQGEPIIDERDNVIGLWGTIQDITDRKMMEKKIQKSEEELWWLLRSMINAFVIFESVFDEDHNFISYRFVYINEAYERITGVKNEEVRGKTVHEVWPDTEPEWIKRYGSVAVTGKPQSFELYHDPTKKYYHCNVYRPWKTDERFCVVFEDITERKHMLEELRENQKLLNDMADSAKIGGWEMDMQEGGIARWTKGTYDIVEIDYDDYIPGYDEHVDYYLPAYRDMVKNKMEELLKTSKPMHFRAPLKTKKGKVKWCEAYGHAITENGKVVRLRGTFQDITERHKVEKKLEEYREHLEDLVEERTRELKASNRELEAFSFSVSHDLRAPLRSIDGFSQLILDKYSEGLGEKARDYFNRIRSASGHMAELIDDLLQLSRITRMEVKRTKFDLSQLTRKILDELAESEPDRDIKVNIQKDLETDADEELMGIVMKNLIDNAWKFSSRNPKTIIEIGAFKEGDKKVFFIKDNGVGFDSEYKDKLFRPFQRLHSESEFPGTGVGLASVQSIISKHGGKIWAESEIGKGATFYFTLN